MSILDIQTMPTVFVCNGHKYHESILKYYNIVQKTKELLARGTPQDVTIEIIEEMEKSNEDNDELDLLKTQDILGKMTNEDGWYAAP